MVRKKCRPQKLPAKYNKKSSYCECPKYLSTEKLFEENVKDITKSLILTMIVCGIHECKAKNTRDIIVNVFNHYNEARHGIECAKPPTKLCKKNILCCLAKNCLMTLVEAQLTYYIMKYALKAFFNRIPRVCVRNPVMDQQLLSEYEMAWTNAAKRTIKVYTECDGIMKPLIPKYKDEIFGIYRRLFESIKKRAEPLEMPQCSVICGQYEKVEVPTRKRNEQAIEETDCETKTENEKNPFANFRKCCKCKLPLDLCDCNVNPKSGKLCMDCSQGPYVCEWYRLDKEPRVKAKDHVCPIDCADDLSLLSEDVCQCDLQQLSDCEVCESCSEEESDFESNQPVCVEESESEDEEVEPKMEGCCYCCHMPMCNRTVHMEKDKPPPKRIPTGPIFVESQTIPPGKVIKNVRLPPEVPKKLKSVNKKTYDSEKTKKDKTKQANNDKDDANKKEDEKKDDQKKTDDEKDKVTEKVNKTDDTGRKTGDVPLEDKGRKSEKAPLTRVGDELAPPVARKRENEDKLVTAETDRGDPSLNQADKNKREQQTKNDGDKNKKPDGQKKIIDHAGSNATLAKKTSKHRKKPFCTCKKVKIICKKCLPCRPAVAQKNRLIPAPILC